MTYEENDDHDFAKPNCKQTCLAHDQDLNALQQARYLD